MRLSAWDLTIERGGRRLIAGLSFAADQGAAVIVTGPNGAGKSTLLRALCGFLPLEAGGFALEGGDAERSLGEQAHYLGHADGVKGALTAGENLAFAAAMLGGQSSRDARASGAGAGGSRACDRFPRAPALGWAEAARGARPAPHRRIARFGCSTNRRPRSTPPPRPRFATIMRAHLRGGGIIVAATHAPLGLEGAQEVRLGAAAGAAA